MMTYVRGVGTSAVVILDGVGRYSVAVKSWGIDVRRERLDLTPWDSPYQQYLPSSNSVELELSGTVDGPAVHDPSPTRKQHLIQLLRPFCRTDDECVALAVIEGDDVAKKALRDLALEHA
jgi:hypothetical protein